MSGKTESDSARDRARRALLVAGPHRGGSSAIARCLMAQGAAPPRTPHSLSSDDEDLWAASDPIVAAHDELLATAGSSWDDVLAFPGSWHGSSAAAGHRERMAAIVLGEYGDSTLFVISDPRLCRLVPFWLSVLGELDIHPAFVIPVRDPDQVAASLADHDGLSRPHGLLMWLRHLLDAERATRGHPRAVVCYEDLLGDPQASTRAIWQCLEVDPWPAADPSQAELDSALPCEGTPAPTREGGANGPVVGWVEEAHAVLLDAGRTGKAPDVEALDRLSDALADADRTYGAVLAQWRGRADALDDATGRKDRSLAAQEKLRRHLVRQLTMKLRSAERKIAATEQKLREIDRARGNAERKVRELKRALASLEGSLSWRLTKPLRTLKASVKRPRGRIRGG